MVKIVCDKCGREVYMKNPDLTGRAKIGYEEYDLCKYCILDIKRFINQGKADRKDEPTISKMEQVEEPERNMAEDIVESFGFKAESYRQAKAKDEPQTDCAWK